MDRTCRSARRSSRSAVAPRPAGPTGRRARRRAGASGPPWSEEIEIFALLPLRDLGVEAGELGALEAQEVVDEALAQPVAEHRAGLQRDERGIERGGQRRRRGLVGRVGGWPG